MPLRRLPAWALFLNGLVFVHTNGRVAFQRTEGDTTFVLFDKGREPCVSPDGKRVVYWTSAPASPRAANATGATGTTAAIDTSAPLVWADVDGGARGQLRAGNLRSPHFSPDGKQLIWGEMVDGRWAVMRGNRDGSAATLLFRGPESVFHASWLPDGSGILTHDLDNLYWVALDGRVRRQTAVRDVVGAASISSDDRFLVSPADGNRLLFSAAVDATKAMDRAVHYDGGSSALFLYDLAGGRRTRLTGEDVFAHDPAWSRDGKSISCRGFRIGKRPLRDGILRVPVDGGEITRVAPGSEPSQ
ncbi:MAG: putative acylaminoacyl-peptidase protein [Myxococcales bacterium]|nr:putative acylaminoacyl-peptidase protein [Myxococcales bacterium]